MIKDLIDKPLPGFASGRYTSANRAEFPADSLEKAKNVVIHDDGIQSIRGYALLNNLGFSIDRILSFERQVDTKQFLLVVGAGQIVVTDRYGKNPVQLKAAEPSIPSSLIQDIHSAYISNDANAYTLYDSGDGNLTARIMGQKAPLIAPAISSVAGPLTLKYGRRYCYAEVVYWTDAQGVQRYHIGPPSPFSAHTGPLGSVVVNVALNAAVNPATTHFWVFATEDSEVDTSASFSFMSEVVVGTTVWGDTLLDTSQDTTRPAPFNNYPPVPSSIFIEYEGLIASLSADTVALSGLEEIILGIPKETFPLTKRFKLPSGVKKLTGGANYAQSLMLGTDDSWSVLLGSSVSDFQKRDRVLTPGPAGYKCTLISKSGHLLYLSRDKALRAWDGTSPQAQIVSTALMEASVDPEALSMKNISTAQLADCELIEFASGDYTFAILACSVDGTKTKAWLQMWDISDFVKQKTADASETDMVPGHNISTVSSLRVDGENVVYMGDTAGNLFTWPSGDTFADKPIIAIAEGPPTLLGVAGMKLMHWLQLFTNRPRALDLFKLKVGASNAAANKFEMNDAPPVDGVFDDDSVVRFNLKMKESKVALAKFFKWRIEFPQDGSPTSVHVVIPAFVSKPGIDR